MVCFLFPFFGLYLCWFRKGTNEKDPGFCNTNVKMVHVTIDMNDPKNQNPEPELEEGEFIEVFTLPLKTLWDSCKSLEKEGYAIDARVGSLAEGIEMARQFRL
jgi:ADP-ribose pyrophosphatase